MHIEERIIHEHGFVRLMGVQGSDQIIEDSARVSYGLGTRQTSQTRSLLRYLMRNQHSSPYEMAGVLFQIKLPIFVMRQLVRTRTASLNEYSGRYSIMSDEFYMPDNDHMGIQAVSNKQGRDSATILNEEAEDIRMQMKTVYNTSYETYQKFIDQGVSREIARMVLPVSNYTECYWKINLRNFFHFLNLRMDEHAQQEIRDYANAMHDVVKPYFPLSFEAWKDYQRDAKTISGVEVGALKTFLKTGNYPAWDMVSMSKREYEELCSWLGSLLEED